MFLNLETIPLFKSLERDTLKKLEPLFEPYECAPKTVIFEQGDPAVFVYFIQSGIVEIRYKPYDGPAIVITTLPVGSIFGWSAAIGNASYTSETVCKEALVALRVRGTDLHRFCIHEPDAGYVLLERLADAVSTRWANAREQIHSLLNTSVNRGTISVPGKERR